MATEFKELFILIAFLAFLPVSNSTATNTNRRQLPSLLIAPEFKLETKVKIIREKFAGIDEEISLTEYYSNEQQKVKLQFSDQEESVDYYYDTSQFSGKQLIKATNSPTGHIANCEIVDFKKFAYQLFGALSSYDEHLTGQDWTRERDEVPDYVIGLARLLFIIESNKNKLIPDVVQDTVIIRNHETIKYRFEDNQSVMRVFYPQQSELKSDLPLRVLLTLPNGSEIMVDYLAMKQLKEQDISKQTDDGIDQFTYPISEECSNKLKPSSIFSIDRFLAPKVFSFEAEIIEMGNHFNYEDSDGFGTLGKYFVAYDGHVKVLRIDSKVNSYSLNEDEYSTSVYVPRRNRKFNMRPTLINLDKQQQTSWACISSKISVDGQIQHSFAEPLIPFDKLAHVGRGQVRGVECIVFATIELVDLPKIFFPQVSYHDGEKARLVQDNTKKDSSKGGEAQYISVYYFSLQQDEHHGNTIFSIDNEQQLGPLMRIDLHKPGEGIVYRIEAFNFAWTLSDAPNGDRKDELFSLYEKCSNINNKFEDKYAQLTMNLEFTSEVSEATNEPVSIESLNKVIGLFESPDVRNFALTRAISINSNLMLTQINEFKSHLRPLMLDLNPKLFIRIEAKLSNQVYDLYEAAKVGNGILEESFPNFAKSFDECYWEAAHMRRYRAHILFSFCYSHCIINESPYHVDSSSANEKAGFFAVNENEDFIRLDENSACEILRMDLKQRDIPADNIISKFWTSFYHNLRGLKLPVFVYDQQGNRASFLVNHIDVYNNKWLNLQREPIFKISSSDRSNDVLNGLALSLTDGSTKRVELRKVWNQFEKNASERHDRMNFDLCHSSCMANMSCKSYSVCYAGNQVHCLTSDLEFKSTDLFGRINKKIEALKMSDKSKGPIKVDFYSRNEQDRKNIQSANDDKTSLVETHELWVDNKCQTYNKNALEMFIQSKVVLAKLKNKYVLPVESEDQCAELCLKQNINFFKRTASFKLKYLESQGLSNENYLTKLLEKQNSEIRSWCSGFRFLNLATSMVPDTVRHILRPSKLRSNGLCSVVGPDWITNQQDDEKEEDRSLDQASDENPDPKHMEQLVAMQSYDFVYSMLYERHYGIKLIKTDHDPEGAENNYLVDAQLSSNNQIILDKQSDIEFCARACFSQKIDLKPWCKSFEFIEDKSDIILAATSTKTRKAKERVNSYCVFNSLSLNDIFQMKSPELFIDTNIESDKLTVWHFELRSSYTLDDLIASRLIITENLDFYNENVSQFRLQTLGITIVLLLSLVSGLCCGLTIGYKLIDGTHEISSARRRESIENPSRSFLNSLISGISGNPNEISHRSFESDLDLPDLSLEVCDTPNQ